MGNATQCFPTKKTIAWLKKWVLPKVDRLEIDYLHADLEKIQLRIASVASPDIGACLGDPGRVHPPTLWFPYIRRSARRSSLRAPPKSRRSDIRPNLTCTFRGITWTNLGCELLAQSRVGHDPSRKDDLLTPSVINPLTELRFWIAHQTTL